MRCRPGGRQRRSIRLKGYDYSSPGAYFITICTQYREQRFGQVVDDEMRLNDAGNMLQIEWLALPARFPAIELDEFVIMPNHMHGLIFITPPTSVGATLVVALQNGAGAGAGTSPAPTGTNRPTLGDVIGAFKSITTDRYIAGVRRQGWPPFVKRVWQRNYYEHIVRNERALRAIRRYIQNNPLKWTIDRDNLQKTRALPPPASIGDYLADIVFRA